MKRFVLRSLFAALALCVAGPAFAGDPGAPSVEGLRRAIYDWSGPYAGTFVGGSAVGGLVGPSAIADSDSKWIFGWAAGAGVEQAFTGALRARLEYLYVGLPDTTYTLSDGLGVTVSATQTNKSMQMLRLALAYKFNW